MPYPAETEIIANVVTSPHHLSATMVTGRVHRMTELFGRLAPGADLESARAELRAVHGAMVKEHPEAYSPKADFRIDAVQLRDQITSPARTVLLSPAGRVGARLRHRLLERRQPDPRALGAARRRAGRSARRSARSAWALRRTLLAESLLLCGAGAMLGVLIARPMVALLARYAARFSVRALDLTVDASLLWVGVGWRSRRPCCWRSCRACRPQRRPKASACRTAARDITSGTNRRLRIFAVTQIAASFVLLAGAGMLLTALFALQATQTGFKRRNVLALHVPGCRTDGRPTRSSPSTRK